LWVLKIWLDLRSHSFHKAKCLRIMEVSEDLISSYAKVFFRELFRNLSMGQIPDSFIIGYLPH
jgi:hypothetical protein